MVYGRVGCHLPIPLNPAIIFVLDFLDVLE